MLYFLVAFLEQSGRGSGQSIYHSTTPPLGQPFAAGELRTLETPQKLPVWQESQMHALNPMQKHGKRLRGIKNSALGRRQDKQGMFLGGGK